MGHAIAIVVYQWPEPGSGHRRRNIDVGCVSSISTHAALQDHDRLITRLVNRRVIQRVANSTSSVKEENLRPATCERDAASAPRKRHAYNGRRES